MERRSLLDSDMPPSGDNPNVFDDEFEVEDVDGIADGFRPGHNHDREGSSRQDQDSDDDGDVPIHSVSAHYATNSVTPTEGPSRNSTRKSRSHVNPFASPEDDVADPPLERTASGNFAPYIAHRSVSSASSNQYAGTSSPRFGSVGPSHPYGMYPQGTMARTPSVATASTARPQRQSSSRRGPQHPYALYTQGVGDDSDDEVSSAPNPVPVGFLGLGATFQRRRGPDGEEQDIIGDYGHTEQLPPYTRYPEDGPEKPPLLDVPNPPTALHSRAPVLGTDPGMALMHTPLQPVQQSMTDVSNLNRQPSTMSRTSMLHGDQGSSSLNSLKSKKSWSEKSWKEKRKTRFCGIPFWWFLLAIGVLAFIAAVLGGVIGGFVEGQEKKEAELKAAASTLLYDASFIATATNSQPPATGTYTLSLGTPQETQAACLTDPSQRSGWSCDLAGDTEISIVVDTPPGSDQPGARLITEVINTTELVYGAQRSNMRSLFSPFLLVKDNADPDYGTAFYFEQQYQKLVVVPEGAIDMPSKKIKRGFQPTVAAVGDKPWFCYWNDTFVEGFMYPNKKVTTTSSTPSSATPSPTSTGTFSNTVATTATASVTAPWDITWAQPAETVTTTVAMPSTTTTYTGAASAFPTWLESNYPVWYKHGNNMSPPGHRKRDDDGDGDNDTELYPYLIKIEERRLAGSPPPFCIKYQVLNNLNWNWIPNDDGQQITMTLSETDPSYSAYEHAGIAGRKLRKRLTVPGECHCQWQSGEQ